MSVEFIAECGKNFIDYDWQNEERDLNYHLDRAKELVLSAVKAGADTVKFQCHVLKDEGSFRSQKRHKWIAYNERITPVEFWEDLSSFVDAIPYIDFLVTPMSKMAAQKVNKFVKRWKVGSGNVTDYDLLNYIADTGKPVILSTGMSLQGEVDEALYILRDNKVSLLYCNSIYPCPIDKIDLDIMVAMKKHYGLPVGFSDHTEEITTPMFATMRGADIVEKHFTLDKNAHGPDHALSLEPDELKRCVQLVRAYEDKVNSAVVWVEEDELPLRDIFRDF